jgi:hypothetical protein
MEITKNLNKENLRTLSDVALVAGLLSIVASIATWFSSKEEDRSHAERFGIFVGLWVPSFLILSNRLSRAADSSKED